MSRRKRELAVILTVGHSSRSWDAFHGLLKTHHVDRIVDVRSIPGSRRNPQFNREGLARKLRAAGIGYVYLRKLGGLRHPKRDSMNVGWRNASFRGFADYMEIEEFQEGINRLQRLAAEKRCALMCAEGVPWRCHRSLIADALLIRGIPVEHIMGRKRREKHSLTPFASVRRGRIIYPAQSGIPNQENFSGSRRTDA